MVEGNTVKMKLMSNLQKEKVLKGCEEGHEVERNNEGEAGELQQSFVRESACAGRDPNSLHLTVVHV